MRTQLVCLVLILVVFAVSLSIMTGCNKPAPTGAAVAPAGTNAGAVYTCPMHPEVQSKTPGQCPKCGMNLVKKG